MVDSMTNPEWLLAFLSCLTTLVTVVGFIRASRDRMEKIVEDRVHLKDEVRSMSDRMALLETSTMNHMSAMEIRINQLNVAVINLSEAVNRRVLDEKSN